MVTKIIETFDLSKVYKLKHERKQIVALNNVNLSINEGEIFGLLGPNGAGKTTLVSILTTLKQPTSGYAIVDGYNILKNPKYVRSKVSLMLGSNMLYYRITAYENLKFFSKIYGIPNYKQKIDDLAKELELDKWLNEYVENFSSGMKMKLALLKTILLDTKILFLDEPTLGLDVKSISLIIQKLKKIKKTIFLTSHDMNVVEKLCNRIAFINKGNILKIGLKEDVKKLEQSEIGIEIDVITNKEKLSEELSKQDFINNVVNTNNGLLIDLKSRAYYNNILEIITKYKIQRITEHELSLEDLFLKLS